MRIVYILTRADEIGGAQVHVRDLATALHSSGHEVSVLAGSAGSLSDQLVERGVPFEVVPALVRPIVPWKDALAVWQLRSILRRLRPDLVSVHTSKAGWLGRVAAKSSGIPVVFTAHGWAFTEGRGAASRRFYTLAERAAAPLADQIITVSEYDRILALAHRIAPPQKIMRIYNGVVDRAAGSPARHGAEVPGIVMIGRFAAPKDHLTLLRALGQLRGLRWRLDLVGDGHMQAEAIALADTLGIADRVRFLGERPDVSAVLAEADIGVLISNWEGFPRSILETMSAGLPVVASDVGGISEAVQEGETGFLVPRSDERRLTERLRLLISSAEACQRLGAAGRRRYEKEFRFERMFEQTVAVYQRVLAREGSLRDALGDRKQAGSGFG
jgi:glycosyltransferase involved in cell wall biosynthesis